MGKRIISTSRSPKGTGPYCQGLRVGNLIFVSGQGPLDPESSKPMGTTIREQAEVTLQNVKNIIEEGGASMKDVVKVGVFLTDLKHFEEFNEIYRKFFTQPFPCRVCVEAGLAEGTLVEIDAIAYVSNS